MTEVFRVLGRGGEGRGGDGDGEGEEMGNGRGWRKEQQGWEGGQVTLKCDQDSTAESISWVIMPTL